MNLTDYFLQYEYNKCKAIIDNNNFSLEQINDLQRRLNKKELNKIINGDYDIKKEYDKLKKLL